MDLNDVRKYIDRLDFEIVKLLNRRMELAVTSRKFKKVIDDPAREGHVLKSVESFSGGLIRPEFSRKLFESVIGESRQLQRESFILTGFQGEHGANSESAALSYLPKCATIPCASFSDIFEGVEKGYLDFGVVPVENSLGGMVSSVNELMAGRKFYIHGEILLPVHHALLSLPETHYRDIRVVYSHPQALAQCAGFLKKHKMEGKPFYDTAGAAKMLFAERPEASAVIAGKLCSDLYHLEILKEHIEDHPDNVTRFLIISREESRKEGDKCSIVFSTKHTAGSLFRVLELFADNEVNLTRIESVPMGGRPGNYVFFLDFLGSVKEKKIGKLLINVKSRSSMYRFLGCYPAGGAK